MTGSGITTYRSRTRHPRHSMVPRRVGGNWRSEPRSRPQAGKPPRPHGPLSSGVHTPEIGIGSAPGHDTRGASGLGQAGPWIMVTIGSLLVGQLWVEGYRRLSHSPRYVGGKVGGTPLIAGHIG
jgi:hypothetical protein